MALETNKQNASSTRGWKEEEEGADEGDGAEDIYRGRWRRPINKNIADRKEEADRVARFRTDFLLMFHLT